MRAAILEVDPDDFQDDNTREMFTEIHRLVGRGLVPDPVVILQRFPHLEPLANEAISLPVLDFHVPTWADTVRVDRCRRDALKRVEQAQRALVDPSKDPVRTLSVLQDQAQVLASRAAGVKRAPTLAEVLDQAMDPARLDPGAKIPTGFSDFDHIIGGGYEPGDMVVIAGRPGMGKTTFVVNMLRRAIELGEAVVFDSLEMKPVQIVELLTQACANTDRGVRAMLQGGDQELIDRYASTVERIREHPIQVLSAATPAKLRSQVEKHRQQHGTRLVVVDYLQLMQGDKSRYGSRQEEIADISRKLKLMALESECAVLALSQLSRAVETRTDKRPVLSDLRDSGQIEQDADVIVFLYREEYYTGREPGEAELIVAKNRTGYTGKLRLAYRGSHRRFDELEERF